MSQAEFEQGLMREAADWARRLTGLSPEDKAFLDRLSQSGALADQRVLQEMEALRLRGEDLANPDVGYMERAYRPAFERLMQQYQLMDRAILEDMNRRGVLSGPQGGSEPEAYQRMLLARDTKDQMGRVMLEAQNQAVQQKLAQYQGRLAEMNQANLRFGQTQAPVIAAHVAPASDRLNALTNAATNMANTKFGYAKDMHAINSGRKIAGQDRLMSMIGAGTQAGGSILGGVIAGMLASDQNLKTDFQPAQTPEESLQDIDRLRVQEWRYQDSPGMHMGAMAQDMPPDLSPDGTSVDVVSYLGKLTQAVQALNDRIGRYEKMLQGGVA